jgi:hypothetical protein
MTNRLIQLGVCAIVAALPTSAFAQADDAINSADDLSVVARVPNGESFDPDNAIAPVRLVEGAGVKIGEGTVLHPVVGIETGAVSNVFYSNQNNCTAAQNCVVAAGVLRLLAQMGWGSLSLQRLVPGGELQQDETAPAGVARPNARDTGALVYRVDLRAAYDFLLSGNSDVEATGGLSLGATVRAVVNPTGKASFTVTDDYERLIRAANFETSVDTDRDINDLNTWLTYHPPGSAITGFLYYENVVDVFERSEQQFANRDLNVIGIHPQWRLLPQTQVFVDLSQGYDTGIGTSSTKVTSYPTIASTGVVTYLTPNITLNATVGFVWANYKSGPSYVDPVGGAGIGYRWSPFGRAYLSYNYTYADSIQANYYQESVIRLWAYQILGPFVVSIQPEVHFRTYEGIDVPDVIGPSTRDDTIYAFIAGVSYNFRNWINVGLDYRFTDDSTNYRYMSNGETIDPSYVRNAVLLGVRAAL